VSDNFIEKDAITFTIIIINFENSSMVSTQH